MTRAAQQELRVLVSFGPGQAIRDGWALGLPMGDVTVGERFWMVLGDGHESRDVWTSPVTEVLTHLGGIIAFKTRSGNTYHLVPLAELVSTYKVSNGVRD